MPQKYTNNGRDNIEVIEGSAKDGNQLQVLIYNYQKQSKKTGDGKVFFRLKSENALKKPISAKRQ